MGNKNDLEKLMDIDEPEEIQDEEPLQENSVQGVQVSALSPTSEQKTYQNNQKKKTKKNKKKKIVKDKWPK